MKRQRQKFTTMTVDLQISAGTGPTECRQFVAHLSDALTALCCERGGRLQQRIAHGTSTAPRSISLSFSGLELAQIEDLIGTHTWLHRGEGRGRNTRKRWHVGVKAWSADDAPTTAKADEIAWTACRARGPGGQNVNRRATAVRAVHLPTGLSVRAEAERSQSANRKTAIARLRRRLVAQALAQDAQTTRAARSAHYRFERGNARQVWRGAGPLTPVPG